MNKLESIEPNFAVEAELGERIADKTQITFAEFMDVCLYSPNGYYASRAGIGIDFKTASGTHPAYGRTIANAIEELAPPVDRPRQLLEMGAGTGILATNVLGGLSSKEAGPNAYSYNISEISADLIKEQQRILRGWPVTWHPGSAEQLRITDVDVAFSNELLDVFPVNRLVITGDNIEEIYVTTDRSGRFVEVLDSPSPETLQEIEDITLPELRDGVEFAVSPAQRQWLQTMANSLRTGGHLLTIDYPVRNLNRNRSAYVPRVYANFLEPPTGHPIQLAYERPGCMDITASVDFARLSLQGLTYGLETIYRDTQAGFLKKYRFPTELDKVMDEEAATAGVTNREAHYFAGYLLTSSAQMGGHEVMIQRKQ